MSSVSIVIPVFRSEKTLFELYSQISSTMDEFGWPYEVIFVEDCGSDNSWKNILKMADRNPSVHGIRLSRNFGQHNALLCGIREARYEFIVTMDDDLQHPPDQIPLLLNKLSEGYDVVYGAPSITKHSFLRSLASRMVKIALQRVMGAETALHVNSLRAFRTNLRDAFKEFRGPSPLIDVLLTWATSKFTFVKVMHFPRRVGTSNYTIKALITHSLNLVTGFSVLPLQIASLVGFFFTVFGFVLFAWITGRYFIEGATVPGFTFLAAAIVLFSGVQLFCLGMIGEYLARIHFRIMDRPTYHVSEHSGSEKVGKEI